MNIMEVELAEDEVLVRRVEPVNALLSRPTYVPCRRSDLKPGERFLTVGENGTVGEFSLWEGERGLLP